MCHLTPLVGVAAFAVWHARKVAGTERATWGGFSPSAALTRWGEYLK
jgi:hypothetical protein